MKYTKIELKGYKRFQLNNIQYVSIEPKEIIQMILGTNGCGKTSLLREITPLPSQSSQYDKDGYKLLEIIHNNSLYKVINTFDGKNTRYRLIKDSKDIFEGTTATDFRSLIRTEFGLTPEIQSLIDGVTKFSTMDIAKRRYWFTLLSKADYTFAFEYYNKIKSRIRDLQGALNISQNRYASELSKIMSEEDIQNNRRKLDAYKNTLNQLLEDKPRINMLRRDIEISISNNDKDISEYTNNLINIRMKLGKLINGYNKYSKLDFNSCQELIYKLNAELEQELNNEKDLHKLLEETELTSSNLIKIANQSVNELIKQKNDLLEEIVLNTNNLSVIKKLNITAINFQSSFESIYHTLRDIFDQLPSEGLNSFTKQARILNINKLETLENNIRELDTRIKNKQNKIIELDYIKNNHKRTCPNCNHQWIHGYEESVYNSIKDQINSDLITYEDYLKQKDIILESIKEHDRIFNLVSQYRQVVNSWPILSQLWDVLFEIGITYPKKLNNALESILRDIPYLLKVDVLNNDLNHLDELLVIAKKESNNDLNSNQIKMESLELKLSKTNNKIRHINKELDNLTRYKELLNTINVLVSNIEDTIKIKQNNISKVDEILKAEHYNRLIQLFRQEVSVLEQSISKIDIQQTLLEQLKEQSSLYQEEIRILKLAEVAMSPSVGLIAKGLTGFINLFIGRMNHFVKHIWTYPLEILPISINDSLELDYKFEVEIDHRFRAPDVKVGECNNSTCEVFDLAFRIAAMECLGLNDYPVQLDEFGSSFDSKHRNVAFQVVANLTTSTDVSQIFMVSHAEQSYGSLKNADTIILDQNNIVIPDGIKINNNVCIK